jgi:hypothetical protein
VTPYEIRRFVPSDSEQKRPYLGSIAEYGLNTEGGVFRKAAVRMGVEGRLLSVAGGL